MPRTLGDAPVEGGRVGDEYEGHEGNGHHRAAAAFVGEDPRQPGLELMRHGSDHGEGGEHQGDEDRVAATEGDRGPGGQSQHQPEEHHERHAHLGTQVVQQECPGRGHRHVQQPGKRQGLAAHLQVHQQTGDPGRKEGTDGSIPDEEHQDWLAIGQQHGAKVERQRKEDHRRGGADPREQNREDAEQRALPLPAPPRQGPPQPENRPQLREVSAHRANSTGRATPPWNQPWRGTSLRASRFAAARRAAPVPPAGPDR